MDETSKRALRVFLCHASADKPAVRKLSHRLTAEGWIDPWLDEEKLSLGQHWTIIIEEALAAADIVLIFLSHNSVQKEGFVQRELSYAWELSLEKPRNVIFLIPFRLDDCEVPRYLSSRQWGDYFGDKEEGTYQTLVRSLTQRYQQKLQLEAKEQEQCEKAVSEAAEKIALEKTEREKIEREAVKKSELQKARREAREKSKREKLERKIFEKKALENAELEARENLEREKAEHESAEKLALRKAVRESKWQAEREKVKHALPEKILVEENELNEKDYSLLDNKEIVQSVNVVVGSLESKTPENFAVKKKQINYEGIFVVVAVFSCALFVVLLLSRGLSSAFRPAETKIPFVLPTLYSTLTETQYPTDTPLPPTFTITPSVTPTDTPLPPTFTITPSVTPYVSPTSSLTATPTLPTEIADSKGVKMALVPSEEFYMGNEPDKLDPQYRHAVLLDSFYIDEYEVTNQQFVEFLNAVSSRIEIQSGTFIILNRLDSKFAYSDRIYTLKCQYCAGDWKDKITWNSGQASVRYSAQAPVTLVSWYGADAYCRWRNPDNDTRLPTEAEWELAARGNGNFVVDGRNDFGIYNMVGGALEWVSDQYSGEYYSLPESHDNPKGPEITYNGTKVLRGDNDDVIPIEKQIFYRSSKAPSYYKNSSSIDYLSYKNIGFRCARSVIP
jgi:formylglycine-generating enzyme required for sulfatase activity